MNYRDMNTLNKNIIEWLPSLPRNIHIIVGIPRSGLLVANLISLYMNLPMTDIDGFLAGRVLSGGLRLKNSQEIKIISAENTLNILVVDDSLWSGNQLNLVKEQITQAKLNIRVFYGVVYIIPGQEELVDYYYEVLPIPRIFQWNIMHSWLLEISCVDIDGVLCVDPTEDENDDGEKYLEFIDNAVPLLTPIVKIHTLVTSRLEKYRESTVVWLRNHNIDYDELIMLDLPNKEARQKYGHGRFKAEIFRNSKSDYLFESSLIQAVEIAKRTHKIVFCVETMDFIELPETQIVYYFKTFLRGIVTQHHYQKIVDFYLDLINHFQNMKK